MSKTVLSGQDINRINKLVDHLLSGTAVNSRSLISAERVLNNFLSQNSKQLQNKFRSSRFFPEIEYKQVIESIHVNLYNRVSASALPVINNFIDNSDFSFLDIFSEAGSVTDKFRKTKFHEFVMMIFKNSEARFNMDCAVNILRYRVVERYIGGIYEKKDFIFSMLEKEFGATLSKHEIITYIKIVLLARNIVFLRYKLNPIDPETELSIYDVPVSKKMINMYSGKLVDQILPSLPGIPRQLLNCAVKSNFPSVFADEDEVLSSLVFILGSRFKYYNHTEIGERGTVSPDNSWFTVAEKNAEYFGFDKSILKALNLIALENNW